MNFQLWKNILFKLVNPFLFIGLMLGTFIVSGQTVTKQLYLSNPGQGMDRVHPGLVVPVDNTTATSSVLGSMCGGAAGTYTSPTDITQQFGGQNSITPDMAVYTSPTGVETIHIVFLGKATGALKKNIYYSSKTGAGAWSTPVRISNDGWNQDAQENPSIAVDVNNKAYVVYAHKNGVVVPTDSKINIYYVTNVSGSWSTPVRISSDVFGQDAATPEIALDANSKAHVVFNHKRTATSPIDSKINVYYVTNSSGSWVSPVRISNDGFGQDVKESPSITIDASNKAHVAYTQKNSNIAPVDLKINIYYTTNVSGSWSTAERISNDAANQDAQSNPSIAVDAGNNPHVVYSHKDGSVADGQINVYYTNKVSGAWSSWLDLSNDVDAHASLNPDIVIGCNGNVRVAFANNTNNIYFIENSGFGSSWTSLIDINTAPTTSTDGNFPSVALTTNNVHVVYQDKHSSLGGSIDIFHTSAALLIVQTSTAFTQSPVACGNIVIVNGTVTITLYTNLTEGNMPTPNPSITATLAELPGTVFVTLTNPTYTAGVGTEGTLVWTGTIPATTTIDAGNTIVLNVTTNFIGGKFTILFDSNTKPSKIDFPVSTYINVNSVAVYDAPFPGGNIVSSGVAGQSRYIRSVVSDPFGAIDITALNYTITPPGTNVAGTLVATSGCTRTYEYLWPLPAGSGNYTLTSTANEGYENTVTHSANTIFNVCIDCPPTARNDSATGPGGNPLLVNVLNNDFDPNNNINPGSLTIINSPAGYPKNGSAYVDNGKIIYIPNGAFEGNDTLYYQICDATLPSPLCSTARVIVSMERIPYSACSEAIKSKIYYVPYSEPEADTVLTRSANTGLNVNSVRTIISLKIPYQGMTVIWDQWEDGYEANILNPQQTSTLVWGDGNLFNGVAPGYPTDNIPPGGSIVLDNTIPTNPRVQSNIFFDGRDKIYSSGQIAMTQVCGEPATISVQCMKTNVASFPSEFGLSFVVPVGQNFPSQDFQYTALLIRASENNTTVNIDRDNNGTFETTFTLQEGQVKLIDNLTAPAGNVLTGAVVTANKPIGLDVHWGGVDGYSSREVPIFPATWYSNSYYTPVPTTGDATAVKDTAVVMLYNSLNRGLTINWSRGVGTAPNSGSITVPAKSVVRFPMELSNTTATTGAGYKFVNPTGESFTAIEIVDSYTPGGGGNSGTTRDWSFNLIAEERLTDMATVAWAPGSTDGTRNDNPIWVTPTANTTIYVKYDGDVTNGGSGTSPCGLHYDVSYSVNVLNHLRIFDNSDNNQSGTAIFTCDGTRIFAVYGEDPYKAVTANPSWDVGSTIQPFCKQKLIFANDDYKTTLVNTPVNIEILNNDRGFLATIDPSTVSTTGLLQPKNGTVYVNADGSILYVPNNGFIGNDTLEYQVCSTPSPIVCDIATVYIKIGSCATPLNQNIISGQVFLDYNQNGTKDLADSVGFNSAKVFLYSDNNCNGAIDANELIDSTNVDFSGYYQFSKYPEKTVADNFDLTPGVSSCASGSDGSASWLTNWIDIGEGGSTGFCVTPVQSAGNTDAEMIVDQGDYALRLDDNNVFAQRQINMQSASSAFLSFAFRKDVATLVAGEDVLVQLSNDGVAFTTVYTISGNGTTDASYVYVPNINITAFNTSATTYLRFATNGNVDEADYVFIDSVSISFLKYNQCFITRVDPSSLPANSFLTTTNLQSTTFTSQAVCVSNKNFGIKKIATFAVNDENSTWQDVNVSGAVIDNDYDLEKNIQTFGTFLNQTTFGTITTGSVLSGINKSGTTVPNAGTITFDINGNYTFDPSPGFTGTVTVPYRICDNGSPSACDSAYLSITVDPLPSAGNSVIANNDENITYGNSISNNLLVNDRDPYNNTFDVTNVIGGSVGTTFTISGIDKYGNTIPNAGTLLVNADGDYTYTPAVGFYGNIKTTYTITDALGATSAALLYIEVLEDPNGPQNDQPFSGDDFNYTTINKPVSGSFINNDYDPNSDPVSLYSTTIVTGGARNPIGSVLTTVMGGTLQFYSDGTYTYTPPSGYIGPDRITYNICDVTTVAPYPLCSMAMLHLLIGPGISISGKAWDDANADIIDPGITEQETNAGNTLYVNLINSSGNVVATATVAANGTYSFSNVDPNAIYSLNLSTTQGTIGQPAPATSLPSGWVNTGTNLNGVTSAVTPAVIDAQSFGFTNVINFDFGIEQLPDSDTKSTLIPQPTYSQLITLSGGSNPPVLSGKDPEDCSAGCLLTNKSVIIDEVPSNTELYYNGLLVSNWQLITNFNPSLLQVKIIAATISSTSTFFRYSYVDVAGKKDPVPATYTLFWLTALQSAGLEVNARIYNNDAFVNWKTETEYNTDYFIVERSQDNINYTSVGKVSAAGNSNKSRDYSFIDQAAGLIQSNTIYYRIKLVQKNGNILFSNPVLLRLNKTIRLMAWPNPFKSFILLNIYSEQKTELQIHLTDVTGRLILSYNKIVLNGTLQQTINTPTNLANGIYILSVTNKETGNITVFKLIKE